MFKKFTINSPTLSLPTAVSKLALDPNLASATAMFKGVPPTNASKPLMSLNVVPTSCEYKSIEDLPKVITSNFLSFIYLNYFSYSFLLLLLVNAHLETSKNRKSIHDLDR